MHWLVPALASPFFFALVNHLDRQLLSRFFKSSGAGSLVLFSSLVGIPVCLLIGTVAPDVFRLSFAERLTLVFNGMLYMVSIIPYFYAMAKDEASMVAPLFQLVSVLSTVLGIAVLGETPGQGTLVGAGLILVGAVILSLEPSPGKRRPRFKGTVLVLMVIASLFTAMNAVVFRRVATSATFTSAAFWEYIGVILFGCCIYVLVPRYRREFLRVLRENNLFVLSLNALNEACAVSGKLLLHLATLLAPVSVVIWVVEGFQPLFVVVIGILLSLVFPRLVRERLDRTSVVQKGMAVGLMLIGTYFMYH